METPTHRVTVPKRIISSRLPSGERPSCRRVIQATTVNSAAATAATARVRLQGTLEGSKSSRAKAANATARIHTQASNVSSHRCRFSDSRSINVVPLSCTLGPPVSYTHLRAHETDSYL